MVVATRNTNIEPIVDENIRLLVTAHVDAALERVKVDMRAIITEASTTHVNRTVEGVSTDVEGTSRGQQPPQFTRMTKIEFPKWAKM